MTDESGNEDNNTTTRDVTPSDEGLIAFSDDFIMDSRDAYTVTDTLVTGGSGSLLYENQLLKVVTGNDVGLSISHPLTTQNTGILRLDFWPLVKYPDGGKLYVRLWAGADSYYELYNTDGYGPKGISKYVGGQKVDEAEFKNGYEQGKYYTSRFISAPKRLAVEAFGEQLVLNGESTSLEVNRLEVELMQQDAYLDNIMLSTQPYVSSLPRRTMTFTYLPI